MPIDQAVEVLIEFVEIETWLLLGGFATVVAYQLLSGRINLAGLLEDKRTRQLDPARVQLLVTTLIVALAYLANPTGFDLSAQTVTGGVLGLSNIFYLVQKYRALSA